MSGFARAAEKGSSTTDSASREASVAPHSERKQHKQAQQHGDNVAGVAEDLPPVDRGILAWSQCLGGFCIFFCTWGMIAAYGAFQSFYQSSLLQTSTPSAISWIGSLQGTLMLFGSALVGPLYDRGYFRILLPSGSFCTLLGMMLTSISTRYWHLILTQGLLTGIGLALIFLPTLALLPTWFVKHRALAISLASAGSGVGGIILPITFNDLVPRIGFAWTVRVLAFLLLFLLLIANALLRPRSRKLPTVARRLFDAQAWKSPPYLLVALTSLLGYMAVYIPFFYIQVYATSTTHISSSLTPYLLPLMNVGYSIGRPLPGLLADRIGASNTLAPCLLASGIVAFCWNAVHSTTGLIVWCLVFGFITAPLGSLGPATIVGVTPDLSLLGVWMGMMFVPLGTGLLIGSPIGGAILDGNAGTGGNWLGLQVFCGVLLIASAVALGVQRGLVVGWGLKKKH